MNDWRFLRQRTLPDYTRGDDAVRIADLFCGCGGMSLGIAEAAHRNGRAVDVKLALDIDSHAARVYEANFPGAQVQNSAVEFFFDSNPGNELSEREEAVRAEVGEVHILLGGPPCQGHSDLNNHTRRSDRRNQLYLHMARAAEVLRPLGLIVENVPAVLNDKGRIVERTEHALKRAGYRVGSTTIDLLEIGLAQRRRRHVLIATRKPLSPPSTVFMELLSQREKRRTVRWAIGDINGNRALDPLHVASRTSSVNAERIAWLFDNEAFDLPDKLRPACHRDKRHTYRSVYGRLQWDKPSQTITTGFTSMGQGRYVHPAEKRTITPREAARLQFFPDFFDFSVVNKKSAWAEMVGNAVPPKLTIALGQILIPQLT